MATTLAAKLAANEITTILATDAFPVLGDPAGTPNPGMAYFSTLATHLNAVTATLTNKTLSLASNTLTGTTAQFNTALSDGSFATLAGTETLTNKTLTAPIISTISNTGTLTLPTSTDTLVGRATTDTLSNKTFPSVAINGNATLTAPSANVLELANGTTGQTVRVFNTRTDSSNGEWAFIRWSGNICQIGSDKNGTGSARRLDLYAGGTQMAQFDSTFNVISFSRDVTADSALVRDLGNSTRYWKDLWMRGRVRTLLRDTQTIASGVIAITGTYTKVDTESAAASDDLDTINGGADGVWLVIQAANDARTVVCKDGTGNLALAGDFSLDNAEDTLYLIYNATLSKWCEISRSDNGA